MFDMVWKYMYISVSLSNQAYSLLLWLSEALAGHFISHSGEARWEKKTMKGYSDESLNAPHSCILSTSPQ